MKRKIQKKGAQKEKVPKWLSAYSHKNTGKDPLLKILLAIIIILAILGGAFYFWYSSRLLPNALTDDDFKHSVSSCYPAQFDLVQDWGILRLETRYCNIVDVRVWDEGDYPQLKGMAMRCRPSIEELKAIPLSELPSHLELCEGELKRSEFYIGIATQ